MSLQNQTNELRSSLEKLRQHYITHDKPENKKDPDFFQYVKEETTPLFEHIDQWQKEAEKFVQHREVNVHPQQVEDTAENVKLLLLHSYYIDVRRKRYMELYHSVLYVFQLIENDIANNPSLANQSH
ncbi:hypothetical protein J416_04793 [Gracilibacillus halophilus YIM-C55.5]|uniref:DUF1798 family protein n=1 Tax=Gracilibacillus halophilus YIM-C55.5 TaxID=1308866 RepID=N4WMA1_9BACI|nr:DUF1798 family protein [Gracilibacillus halophilus]ENH97307.1 hypothetical protein J416_04793 [Gracilibacillus halophilus YIM-C55.5]